MLLLGCHLPPSHRSCSGPRISRAPPPTSPTRHITRRARGRLYPLFNTTAFHLSLNVSFSSLDDCQEKEEKNDQIAKEEGKSRDEVAQK